MIKNAVTLKKHTERHYLHKSARSLFLFSSKRVLARILDVQKTIFVLVAFIQVCHQSSCEQKIQRALPDSCGAFCCKTLDRATNLI